MTLLRIYPETDASSCHSFDQVDDIAKALQDIGVLFERWPSEAHLEAGASQESILKAYAPSVERLAFKYGFESSDVIRVKPDHPDRIALRQKFLSEHTHDDFEVRFFVEGQGLFFLHPDDRVFGILCKPGDLLSVPSGVKHWFDMGEFPDLTCIRLFTTPEGWVAKYTQDSIAESFPRISDFET